jgi:signal-transduction protein with cAMP-binding, CBS, and nucleotidyltransferase domain
MTPDMPGMTRVGEVMQPSPMIVDRLATVDEAIAMMRAHRISSLVIDRRDESDEYGLVVVDDIARKVIAVDRSSARTNVYEIMTKPVLTLPSRMAIRYAIRLLTGFGVSRALVTQNGAMVGIVTLRDMVLSYLEPPL